MIEGRKGLGEERKGEREKEKNRVCICIYSWNLQR